MTAPRSRGPYDARSRSRVEVHLIPMTNPLGDVVLVVPPGATWINRAIESLPAYTRNWSPVLVAWLVSPSADGLLTDAIEAAAGHDEPWCAKCIAWIENNSRKQCPVWTLMATVIESSGFEIVDLDQRDAADHASHRKQREAAAAMAGGGVMGGGFRIPDSVKKLFSDQNSPAHQYGKTLAREGLKQVVRAMGIPVPDSVVEDLFDAFYVGAYEQMRQPGRGGDPQMTPQQAAEILGCAWPCDQAAVTAAFRVKAKETHPDAHPTATETEKEQFKAAFIRVGAAREVLMKVVGGV